MPVTVHRGPAGVRSGPDDCPSVPNHGPQISSTDSRHINGREKKKKREKTKYTLTENTKMGRKFISNGVRNASPKTHPVCPTGLQSPKNGHVSDSIRLEWILETPEMGSGRSLVKVS